MRRKRGHDESWRRSFKMQKRRPVKLNRIFKP